jgi:hypothetical protein
MLPAGLAAEGVEGISSTRRRYDGERRNPWDEAECGHHYARAMAAPPSPDAPPAETLKCARRVTRSLENNPA